MATAWRTLPPNNHAQFLLPVLGPWQAEHLTIYRQLLETVVRGRISVQLANDIAQLVGQHLLVMKPAQREKPWVLKTLRYLGELGNERCRPALDKIINRKKFIFFHLWPEKTRLQARQALGMLERGDRS